MIVKEHQPQLRADIALVFTLPPVGDRQESARTVDLATGVLNSAISRPVKRSWALAIGLGWPRSLRLGIMSSPKKRGRAG